MERLTLAPEKLYLRWRLCRSEFWPRRHAPAWWPPSDSLVLSSVLGWTLQLGSALRLLPLFPFLPVPGDLHFHMFSLFAGHLGPYIFKSILYPESERASVGVFFGSAKNLLALKGRKCFRADCASCEQRACLLPMLLSVFSLCAWIL